MDFFTLRTSLFLVSWVVGAWFSVRVWKSQDPVPCKVVLTVLCLIPVLGPLVVYWISHWPNRLHSDVQARHPKRVNTYGHWRSIDEQLPSRKKKRA